MASLLALSGTVKKKKKMYFTVSNYPNFQIGKIKIYNDYSYSMIIGFTYCGTPFKNQLGWTTTKKNPLSCKEKKSGL